MANTRNLPELAAPMCVVGMVDIKTAWEDQQKSSNVFRKWLEF